MRTLSLLFLQLVDILGSEITQCLSWRRGALLYMYCKTVVDDSHRTKELELYRVHFNLFKQREYHLILHFVVAVPKPRMSLLATFQEEQKTEFFVMAIEFDGYLRLIYIHISCMYYLLPLFVEYLIVTN